MGTLDDYAFRTFPAAVSDDGSAEPATAAWIAAERRGFHDTRASDDALALTASNLVGDGRELTAAYATAGDPSIPVATFASYPGTLNVGAADLLPVHLISNVTVRPTHRRNGLLRQMMTENLGRASRAGFAVAALTVSEATIYRRFGFGVATTVAHSTVLTDGRFRMLTPPPGRSEFVEPAELRALAPAVFARFHAAHPGSVDRHTATWARISGGRTEKAEPDASLYAAAHFADDGTPDGYVSYRVTGATGDANGTDTDHVEIVDLVAADDGAYLGLWELLASIDLTVGVRWAFAPADDPLRWAIADWRAVKQTGVEDWLWLRVLDVAAAFEARGYAPDVAGALTLAVTDDLGYASGTYRLEVLDARATVTRDDTAQPDLTLAAPELAALYLGGVDPRTLRAAARLTEHTPDAARRLAALLTPTAPVYGITHF
ncbi:GNAT family N-acetyltransferase [Subtercola sp. Z020]|uniref:GNAT family N-acetyltransferase n=1 Tax=Subtercola sp. Z020 TaxID=2080582 RepID=UPI000CE89CE3|nr:GNAT family N-acetyltransferase [Subtercola sp. Z020]PPF79873.1 GNAT family N-acetyltransferase [Subtercola sp. Z020]